VDEEKTIRLLIKGIIGGVVVIVLSFVGCSVHMDRKIVQCIESGNDPIECRMALENDGYSKDRLILNTIKELQAERE
jgi:hypothetical protein